MEKKSFTLLQAEAICRQYQHLVNRRLDSEKEWLIDCVAVAPADSLNQWLFAHSYMDFGCPIAARSFYKHNVYDVIVISIHNRKQDMLAFKDIRSYLNSIGETFNVPRFASNDRIDGAARIIPMKDQSERKATHSQVKYFR